MEMNKNPSNNLLDFFQKVRLYKGLMRVLIPESCHADTSFLSTGYGGISDSAKYEIPRLIFFS